MNRGRVVMHRCAIAGVQATTADTTRSFARHSHDTFGVGVVSRGAQRSASSLGQVQARAGDVITVNPGEVHDGSPFDEHGRAWRMLYFDPALVYDVAHELGSAMPKALEFERPVLRDDVFAACFERAFAATLTAGMAADALAREASLYTLMVHLVGRHTTMRSRAATRIATDGRLASIQRAKARIDDDPCTPVTLAGLAAEAGLSRFQFLRGFAHDTGLPPHAYLVQRRVSLACRLLAQGKPLAEAAVGAGFADQSHMTRLFMRTFGVTPAHYAKAVR